MSRWLFLLSAETVDDIINVYGGQSEQLCALQ